MTAGPTQPLVLLKPVAADHRRVFGEAPRLTALEGLKVAFLANGKLLADVFLEAVAVAMRERYDLEAIYAVKPDMSRVSPEGLLHRLAAQSHAIVTGVGD